jgi:hypothetical protein
MSKVAKENASKEDCDSAETRGRTQSGATKAAIAKMMGLQDRSAKAPPPAGAAVDAEPETGGAAAATESPLKTPRDAPGPAAASPEKVW